MLWKYDKNHIDLWFSSYFENEIHANIVLCFCDKQESFEIKCELYEEARKCVSTVNRKIEYLSISKLRSNTAQCLV